MADAPSFDDLENLGRAEQITNRPDLQVNEGDISEMLLKAAAAMADKCQADSCRRFKDTFIDGAEGGKLSTLGSDHWALERFDAVKATGSVEFSRPFVDGSEPAGSIVAGTVIATEADVNGLSYRYVTDVPVAFALGELGPVAVNVTAEIEGSDSNAIAGTVIRVVDNLFDSNLVVTNPLVFAGGAEEETDIEYRERIREYPSTLRRGTLAALEFGAKQVSSVKNATASESASGITTVFVGDVDGNFTAQMLAEVTAELEDWRCAGSVVNVTGGTPLLIDVDYTLVVRTGTNVLSLLTLIESAITGFMDSLKIGDTLYISALQSAARQVDPVNIVEVIINTPAASTAPSSNQLIRTGTVTHTPA